MAPRRRSADIGRAVRVARAGEAEREKAAPLRGNVRGEARARTWGAVGGLSATAGASQRGSSPCSSFFTWNALPDRETRRRGVRSAGFACESFGAGKTVTGNAAQLNGNAVSSSGGMLKSMVAGGLGQGGLDMACAGNAASMMVSAEPA